MTQTIEIDGGMVNLIDRNITHSIPLADWLPKIEKRTPLLAPVLPSGTRAVYWDTTNMQNQQLQVLIELQPTIINMTLDGVTRRLSIPYTRFVFSAHTADPTNFLAWSLQDYLIFWSKRRYSEPNQPDMIPALLPNVYTDARICFGSTGADANQSIADRLDQTVSEFYSSVFNRDLAIRRPNRARGYRAWERMTEKDPSGWMDWEDWDRNNGYSEFYSFNDVTSQRNNPNGRFATMVTPEPIPPVPLGATFGRIQEWLDTLENSQRERMLRALLSSQNENPEAFVTTDVEEDEEDDE